MKFGATYFTSQGPSENVWGTNRIVPAMDSLTIR
jgi:hypothetical protein